ncbi:hypothetical protein V8G54_037498 [Vigna mungo]|uniref:Uncharacterized protein n=1 Tax=Vigna mungo TaxID=3915 RepID=A0AAQ3MJ80_VIGMU
MVEREIIGVGVEVEVGAGGIGVGGRGVLGKLVGFVGRRWRGRRGGGRRRRRRALGVVVDEGVKGVTNCLERVYVSDVGRGECVALVDCFIEKNTAFPAERDRREIVQLGAGTSHGGSF